MSGIRTTTGLISGIDIGGLVDALVEAERAPARRLEQRLKNTQAVMGGLGQLQAQLLTLSAAISPLSNSRTFTNLAIQNPASDQFTITSKSTSLPGNYQLQSVRLASTQRSLSRGFANADTQQIGVASTLTLSREGFLNRSTRLELLNDAQGVRRGTIRITDRSGASANVDLSSAVTLDDVVAAIQQSGLGVQARTVNGRLVLQDTTGQSTSNLIVADLGNGQTAADLGIRQSVADSTLTGNDVFRVTGDFTLNLLNDGNGLRQRTGQPDLMVTLADGTDLILDLDGAATLGNVIQRIAEHADNGGKLTAELQGGRLVLTDHTAGSGALTVANLNGSNAKDVLGLTKASDGGVLTGELLAAGNTVLLRNLRGGRGIEELGQISLTDRLGTTSVVDLTGAETLDDVLEAINTAVSDTSVPLQLRARLNSAGTGIEIVDTSGSVAHNLVIADVGGSTLAADLGIAVDTDANSINSGPLRLRTVNEATSLSTYSPQGTGVPLGAFRVIDSLGNVAVINITSNEKTLGDVIDKINAASGAQISARLNDSGDGIVLIDGAAGPGTLKVEEAGGKTAAGLRLLGEGVVGTGGQQEIVSRRVQQVNIDATDTLNNVISKINLVGGTIKASVVNSGALINGYRLTLNSTLGGEAGRFSIEGTGFDFQFANQETGRDAVLRIGSDPATGFLVTSSSNQFTNVIGNLDVTLLKEGTSAANITASLDRQGITSALQSFVTAYNAYVDLSNNLSKFDTATQTRSALQGTNVPLTVQSRFNALLNSLVGTSGDTVRSLADVGIKLTTNGKLTFDSARLDSALNSAPEQVQRLFSDPQRGFGARLDAALDALNDQFNGSLTMQLRSYEDNANDLVQRIATIDNRLALRRVRLELQFAQMESILSGLQSQSTALTGLTNILDNYKASKS